MTKRAGSKEVGNDSWVTQVHPLDQNGQEHREIFALAGTALCMAQNLEHVLKNFLVLAAAIERRGSRPPLTADEIVLFNADLEKVEAETFKKTLGRLINSIKVQFKFREKPQLQDDLAQSLIDRNKLVHHFFWDTAVYILTSQGRRRMAEELKRIHKQLQQTVVDFSEATKAIRVAAHITDEMINEVVEAAKAGATVEELKEMVRKRRSSIPG
jgi:hypothetical protein